MKSYIEKLKTYLVEHPPDYGDCDARSVLEMLYTYYSQYTAWIHQKSNQILNHSTIN